MGLVALYVHAAGVKRMSCLTRAFACIMATGCGMFNVAPRPVLHACDIEQRSLLCAHDLCHVDQVVVCTSDVPGAGTGGGVWVDLQGLAHASGPQDLPSAPLAFERGQVLF